MPIIRENRAPQRDKARFCHHYGHGIDTKPVFALRKRFFGVSEPTPPEKSPPRHPIQEGSVPDPPLLPLPRPPDGAAISPDPNLSHRSPPSMPPATIPAVRRPVISARERRPFFHRSAAPDRRTFPEKFLVTPGISRDSASRTPRWISPREIMRSQSVRQKNH